MTEPHRDRPCRPRIRAIYAASAATGANRPGAGLQARVREWLTRARRRVRACSPHGLGLALVVTVMTVTATLIAYVHQTVLQVREGLPVEVLLQERDIVTVGQHLSDLQLLLQEAATTPRPTSFAAVFQRLEIAEAQVARLRSTYNFDNLIGASAVHATVNPALLDLRRWLSEGLYGHPPLSPLVLQLALRRLGETVTTVRGHLAHSHLMALQLVSEQAEALEHFRTALMAILGAMAGLGIISIVLVLRSFAAHQRIEAQQRAARAVAEAADAAKSRFLANMSHELRTPMTGVLGMADVLLGTALSEPQRAYLLTLRSSARTLLTILNDVLDLSKIEAGQLRLEEIDFQLANVVGDVVHLLRAEATQKGLGLAVFLPEAAPAYVRGDPTRLQQVLFNLIGNALKFTERGHVAVRLAEHSEQEGRIMLRFEVSDTGVGMTREQLGRLFTPFSQADASVTRRFGGTGLGLTICRRLVTLMGGTIEADSVPGAGSLFRFSVRVQRGSPPTAVATPSRLASQRTPVVAPLRVLVVEDQAVNRMLLRLELERMGHRVDEAANGRIAVEAIQQADYDVVLMDLQMPEMDGITAVGIIRTLPEPKRGLPIIVVTADVIPQHQQWAVAAKVAGFLTKPIDWVRLSQTLAAVAAARSGAERGSTARPVLEAWDEAWDRRSQPATAPGPPLGSAARDDSLTATQDPVIDVAQEPVIDVARTTALRDAVGPDTYTALLAEFKTSLCHHAVALRCALNTGDLTWAHRMAHTIRAG